mmetsp:Transcript_50242/g.101080  ORF Transcript_50242/g.101080 Transcript_50242/m.101080 type:complete len:216 (-) Transcript_50242:238-885(-)
MAQLLWAPLTAGCCCCSRAGKAAQGKGPGAKTSSPRLFAPPAGRRRQKPWQRQLPQLRTLKPQPPPPPPPSGLCRRLLWRLKGALDHPSLFSSFSSWAAAVVVPTTLPAAVVVAVVGTRGPSQLARERQTRRTTRGLKKGAGAGCSSSRGLGNPWLFPTPRSCSCPQRQNGNLTGQICTLLGASRRKRRKRVSPHCCRRSDLGATATTGTQFPSP